MKTLTPDQLSLLQFIHGFERWMEQTSTEHALQVTLELQELGLLAYCSPKRRPRLTEQGRTYGERN